MDLISAILGIIGLIVLYAFFSPLLYVLGKYFLRFITCNRFPPDNPDDKAISNTVGVGLLLIFILFIVYVIFKNYVV